MGDTPDTPEKDAPSTSESAAGSSASAGTDDASPTESERREVDRLPIELRVEYRRLNSFFADYTKNISKGGTFIRTQKPLPPGTEFVFVLIVPKLDDPLKLNGEVMWTTEPTRATDDQPPGMGIRFKYRDDDERRLTEEVVERLVKNELGDHISERLLRTTDQK